MVFLGLLDFRFFGFSDLDFLVFFGRLDFWFFKGSDLVFFGLLVFVFVNSFD